MDHSNEKLDHNSEVVSANVEPDNARLAAEFDAHVANSPQLTDLWSRGVFGGGELTPVEETQVGFMLGDLFYRLEGLYHQHRRGFPPRDSWTPWETLMHNVFTGPMPRRWWTSRAHPFSVDFTAHVDRIAADVLKTENP